MINLEDETQKSSFNTKYFQTLVNKESIILGILLVREQSNLEIDVNPLLKATIDTTSLQPSY